MHGADTKLHGMRRRFKRLKFLEKYVSSSKEVMIEHQRGAIGVAGLGEAIKLVLGHLGSQKLTSCLMSYIPDD